MPCDPLTLDDFRICSIPLPALPAYLDYGRSSNDVPTNAPFQQVVQVALAMLGLCFSIENQNSLALVIKPGRVSVPDMSSIQTAKIIQNGPSSVAAQEYTANRSFAPHDLLSRYNVNKNSATVRYPSPLRPIQSRNSLPLAPSGPLPTL